MANKGGGFAVLVTGFSQITKKRIENKLAAYFQSKKKSGGGECDVAIVENGDALVTFFKTDVQKSVLERTHTITVDGQSIQLSVTPYSGKEENSKDDEQEFSSPVKKDSTCASEDLNKAVHAFNNKNFCGLKTVAEHLPRTRCLHVIPLPEAIVQDYLVLYFERYLRCDNNVEVHMDKSTQSAIMTFPNPEAVECVLSKTHGIKGHTLKMHRYYEGEKLTEFASEQDRNDSRPLKKDKTDSESLTQKNEDETKFTSSFVTEECDFKNKYYVSILKNQHLDKDYPTVQLNFDMMQNIVQITGMENDVLKVQIKLLNKGHQITNKIIHLSEHLRIFLTQLSNEGFLTQMFLDSGINAAYSYDDAEDKGVLYAASEKDRQKAEEKLKMTFAEVTIPIPVNFYMDSANNFKLFIEKITASVIREHLELKDIKEKYLLQHSLEAKDTSGQFACIILVGYRIIAEDVIVRIEKYMDENCMKDFFIEVPLLGVFEYTQRFVNFSDILQNVNVDFVKNEQSLGLQIQVSMKAATQTQTIIMDMLKQVKMQRKRLHNPGAVQFFAKNQDLLKKLENPYQCVIYIENQEGQQKDLSLSNKLETISSVMFLNKFKISVVKHNIAIHEVDAILHLTNEKFDCSTGLSKTLIETGGPEFQESINRLRKRQHLIKDNAVLQSSPGKLSCSAVFHAKWTKSDRQEENVLKKIILAVLNLTNEQLFTSIAIPVFMLGESSTWVMVKAIKEYCEKSRKSDANLTDIRLVSTDDASIKTMKKAVKQIIEPEGKHSKMPAVMKLALKHEKKNVPANPALRPQQEASRLPSDSKVQPDTAVTEINPANSNDRFLKCDGLKVILVKGNIGEQKCDVIVNTVSEDMNLSQGPVSTAILKQAGTQLQINTDKAKGSKNFKAGDVLSVSTKGKNETPAESLLLKSIGNITFELCCGSIFKKGTALVVEYVENKANFDIKRNGDKYYFPLRIKGHADITKSFLRALQKCKELKLDLLYIPVPKQLPSGRAPMDIRAFAAGVLDSVCQYEGTVQGRPIYVIVNDASYGHIQIFEEEMVKLQSGKAGLFHTVTRYLGDWLSGNQTSEDTTNISQHSVEPVKFQIYSMKEENIEAAWADIQKLATKEHMEKTIPVEIPFEKFTEEDLEEIEECCTRMHVCYIFDKADQGICLSGCITDICSVQDVIFKVCHEVGKREVALREEMFIMDKVCWKFWLEDHWETFIPKVNACLEKAYNGKENEIKVKIGGGDYCVIDFQKFTMTDTDGDSFRIDRRCTGDELPDTWDIGENQTACSEVHLKPDSSEYQEVAQGFRDTLADYATRQTFKIDSITRIQNPTLWRLYVARRNEMNRQRPHQQNEKCLYHGTYPDICPKINADGFNRSYCGLNAVFYGDGTYFAQNAKYSAHDTYSKPDANGSKVVYRARVLTGDYCKGEKGLKEPPLKDPQGNSRDRYDSVTDGASPPQAFVVFQDNQAYPEYLISFHV
ncbi:hypothetical protein scyTo_0012996 [Scyliorhinus torazame]|uniref:Poly [ADP-ribose] polymerase n=1 Tax=Scyliorhinus torazame TaxID=75743 RepID=A0A401NM03_SCYTO|nr:hypothetical protein [Scyliorhinus torazame]